MTYTTKEENKVADEFASNARLLVEAMQRLDSEIEQRDEIIGDLKRDLDDARREIDELKEEIRDLERHRA